MATLADNLVEEVLARLNRKQSRTITSDGCDSQCETRQQMMNALAQSAIGMFSTMCGWEVVELPVSDQNVERHEISGIISFSGSVRATIVVSLNRELAFGITEALIGTRPTELNGEVIDLVGELTNMIGGNAKERFAAEGVILGLPTVIMGKGHYVAFESGLSISHLRFETHLGPLGIELGMLVPK